MDWTQRSKYFLESNDGQYRISKARVKRHWIYTAWKRIMRDHESVWVPLRYTEDIALAHAACEEDDRRMASPHPAAA